MKSLCSILFVMITFFSISAQSILLDESYDDWTQNNVLIHEDEIGDYTGNSFDILKMGVSGNNDFIFVYFELDKFINIQEDNNLSLYIDADNDPNTGRSENGIGADIIYRFGDKQAFLYIDGITYSVDHDDIAITTLPSVNSDRFEIMLDRSKTYAGNPIYGGNTISVVLGDWNGDVIPNIEGGLVYDIPDVDFEPIDFSFRKSTDSHFRLLSYNVLKDELFEPTKSDAYSNILKAIDADILGFVEIYDHSGIDTKNKVAELLDDNTTTWYFSSSSPDIRIVSKYPIKDSYKIDGNAAFLIDYNGFDIVYYLVHFPCCENDTQRQVEVDRLMENLRDLKEGNGQWQLEDETPIIISGDMNFVGDAFQQVSLLSGDINDNNQYGPDFNPDWDSTALEDVKPFATGLPSTITWYDELSPFNPGRLDYILYSGSVLELNNSFSLFSPKLSMETLDSLGMDIEDTSFASDHLPIVADFSISNFPTGNTIVNPSIILELSPNPTMDNLHVSNIPFIDNYKVILVDNLGNQIKHENFEGAQFDLDVSSLTNGTYYLYIESANGLGSVSRFIKVSK